MSWLFGKEAEEAARFLLQALEQGSAAAAAEAVFPEGTAVYGGAGESGGEKLRRAQSRAEAETLSDAGVFPAAETADLTLRRQAVPEEEDAEGRGVPGAGGLSRRAAEADPAGPGLEEWSRRLCRDSRRYSGAFERY